MLYHHSCHGKLDLVLLRHCSPPAGLNRAPTAATITSPLICTVSAPRSPGPFCQLNSANRAVPVAFSMAWYESVLHSPARAGGVPAEWLALWPSSLYRNVPSPGSIANVRNTAAAAALEITGYSSKKLKRAKLMHTLYGNFQLTHPAVGGSRACTAR